MTNIYNLFYGVFQAQYVGYFRQAGKLCLFCEILTQSLQVQMTALVDGYRPDPGALPFRHQLPGNDVRMVLALRDQDFVARLDESFAETVGKEIDRRRRTGGEDDLFTGICIQEVLHRIAGRLILIGRFDGQTMDGTMDIGVLRRGHFRPFVNDALRPQAGRGVVQINERTAVYSLRQGREFSSKLFDRHRGQIYERFLSFDAKFLLILYDTNTHAMIDYIKGTVAELTPTRVVLDNHGIGYRIEISLQTYEALEGKTEATVYIYHYFRQREDIEMYYGFATRDERELFELIISVSGIGVNSARMMLSSFSAEELREAILSEDVGRIKSVKGIGLKSAQRLILELKDKIVKGEGSSPEVLFQATSNEAIEEATRALTMLGFTKPNVNKAIQAILKKSPSAKVEEIIKQALKMM